MNVDKVHFRHIMLYKFIKSVKIGIAVKNIEKVYQDCAPSIKTVKKQFSKFRHNCNLEIQPRSGQPSNIDNDMVYNLVDSNPRISTVAEKLNVDRMIAFRHLKKIRYNLKARCLGAQVNICLLKNTKFTVFLQPILCSAEKNMDTFFNRLVTSEKWILYNNVQQRKRTWKRRDEPGQSTYVKNCTLRR